MSLVEHAEFELQKSGLLDEDSDYDGMLGRAVLELVEVFSRQGHSGFSAAATIEALHRILRYEPLTPLTFEPDEWTEVGLGTWQNKRDPTVFSDDGGDSAYTFNDERREREWLKRSS